MIKISIAQQQQLTDILEQCGVNDAAATLNLPANQPLLEQLTKDGNAPGELTIERDKMQPLQLEEKAFHSFVLLPKQLILDMLVISDAGVVKANLPYQLLIDENTIIDGSTNEQGRLYESFATHQTLGMLVYNDELEGQVIQPVRFTERDSIEIDQGLEVRLQERGFSLAETKKPNSDLSNPYENQTQGLFEPLISYVANYMADA